MNKWILLLTGLIIFINLNGITITVNQEGGGDYQTIMEAVNVSVDNDSILVYPGEYHEEVNYQGKTIVIGSLNMTTGEDEYILSTIINGDDTRRGVTAEEIGSDYEAKLIGITIHNCRGFHGGGLLVEDSFLEVRNCIIEHNYAIYDGGGILVWNESGIYLSGTTIRFNFAEKFNGGIDIYIRGEAEFDPDNLCNIYGNYGLIACDLSRGVNPDNPQVISVYVDTFSCLLPDTYFIEVNLQSNNYNWQYLNLNVNTAYYEFYNGDLYVSPNGNDENSGISPYEPMQTVAGAITRITSNPENPHTIHLAAGTYSSTQNNQIFPLNMKGYVNIAGEDMDAVVWDGEGHCYIKDFFSEMEYELKNITLINSNPADWNMEFRRYGTEIPKLTIENLHSIDNSYALFSIASRVSIEMENIIIEGASNSFGNYASDPDNCSVIRNVIVKNGASFVQHTNGQDTGQRSRLDIINALDVDNYCPVNDRGIWSYNIRGYGWTETNMINCTIMNNACEDSINALACVVSKTGGNFNIYNSCVYGNDGYQVGIDTGTGGIWGSTVNISHSLIQDTTWVPVIGDAYSEVNWLGGILDCDPLVCADYTPQSGSPMIDAGTLDLPYDIELPLTDVYGNPRLYGNGIDMGAVEWQGTPVSHDEVIQNPLEIIVYPNPLFTDRLRDGGAKILWQGELFEDMCIEIFNIKGQRLRKLKIENGKLEMNSSVWDLCDEAGNSVSSGVYFVRLKAGDEYVAQRKVTVVK
ncbi:MAG: DUF1565 domain-containing protein [Candidatus Cloacimonetes bacterium]|nr:DUF1565 domain-containing protein [Candidatus Cloacimonadota bacterium]